MKTGVSGATALISSSVGSRFSANWCSVKPPTTRTHCGGGVTRDLALQHGHGVGEAAHAVPAQLHVEVEPAADDVEVVVDQARQHAPALEVDDLGRRTGQRHDLLVVADGEEAAVPDRDRARGRVRAVERREQAVDAGSGRRSVLVWSCLCPPFGVNVVLRCLLVAPGQ